MATPSLAPPSPPLWPLAGMLLLAALVPSGAAIQCYTCNSVTDAYCGDPFTSDTATARTVHCSPDAVQRSLNDASKVLRDFSDIFSKFGVDVPTGTMELAFVCQKVKQTDKKGHQVVLRACAFNPEAVNSCPPDNTGAECIQCNSDLCNGAPAGPVAAGVRLLALLALPAAALRLLRP